MDMDRAEPGSYRAVLVYRWKNSLASSPREGYVRDKPRRASS